MGAPLDTSAERAYPQLLDQTERGWSLVLDLVPLAELLATASGILTE